MHRFSARVPCPPPRLGLHWMYRLKPAGSKEAEFFSCKIFSFYSIELQDKVCPVGQRGRLKSGLGFAAQDALHNLDGGQRGTSISLRGG